MEKRWRGHWLFNHVLHDEHGRSGILEVRATDETAAAAAIKDEVSMILFKTTVMQGHVDVTDVHEVKLWK